MASNKTATVDAKALAAFKAKLKRDAALKAELTLEATRVLALLGNNLPIVDDTALFKEAVKDAWPINVPPRSKSVV